MAASPFASLPLSGTVRPMTDLVWLSGHGDPQKSLVPVSPVITGAPAQGLPSEKVANSHPKLGTNVYISRLPRTITQDQLEKMFQRFGPIISCRVVYHTQGKQGRAPRDPVGFVQFLSPDVAQTAIGQVNGMVFEGKRLVVRLADQDKDKGITSAPSDNLYIANLPKHFKEADLHAIFSRYGNIEDLVVLKHLATGQSKGSGMVRFSTVAEAALAKESLNCARLPDLDYPLEVKYAETKDDKMMRQRQKISAHNSDSGPKSPFLTPATDDKKIPNPSQSGPSPSVFSAAPVTPVKAAQASPIEPSVMSAFDGYLKSMLAHPPLPPISGSPGVCTSVWDPTPSDFAEGSLESDPWELNTYGYSSDGASDGNPGTPSSQCTAGTFANVWRGALTNRPVSRPVSIPLNGCQPLSPLSCPRDVTPRSNVPSTTSVTPRLMSPISLGSPSDIIKRSTNMSTLIRIGNLPPGTTQLFLYQLCAQFGAILSCTVEKEMNGSAVAWLVFKRAEEAAQVEFKLDGHVVQGRELQVQLC